MNLAKRSLDRKEKSNSQQREYVSIVKPHVKCSETKLNKWQNNDQHNVKAFSFRFIC